MSKIFNLNDMPKVGVFFGKMIPPTRGHLTAILNAATQVQKLYVVISDNVNRTKRICDEAGIKEIPVNLRMQWLKQEFQDMPHIKVVKLDETNIPEYPDGWAEWTKLMQEAVNEEINVFFCGEKEYVENLNKYFPDATVKLFDPNRTNYDISATRIREDIMSNWNHILGPARPFFAKRVLIAGSESCVDCDTEFFDGTTWKRIADYKEGDKVLQFNFDYTASIVEPLRYIKSPADKLYKLQNSYGNWSQVYSEDHDIVYLTSKNNLAKKTFLEVMDKHFNNKYGFKAKMLNWFNYSGDVHIDEYKLRLMIAVSADGTEARNKWRIRLLKNNKIERMRYLIEQAGLELDERIYEDGYHNFYIPKEYGVKIFPNDLMHLTRECKDIFADEIFRWDAHQNSYHTVIENNMIVVQFILSSIGNKVAVYKDERDDKTTCYRVDLCKTKFTTIDVNEITEKHRDKMITEYNTVDGYKYCFTVPSGMLVLRRDNHIFITGNCGKTTLTKALAKLYCTSWSEEVGRYYAQRYLGGDETIFTNNDFARIARQQLEQDYEALRNCNKICFFDTDATVTQYYSILYMGHRNADVEACINPDNYDVVFLLKPDVSWVDDGQRLNGDQERREKLHERLKHMYIERGFEDKIVEIGGDYNTRLNSIINYLGGIY